MQLLKNSFIYTISILFQGGIVFLLLPVYTSYLDPTQYGIIAVLSSLTGFLSTFYLLSLHGAATRFYFDHNENEKQTAELFTTLFLFIFGFGIILTFTFTIFKSILIEPFLKGIEFYPYILLSLTTVFFSSFYLLYQAILQVKQQATKYGLLNFIYVFLNAILTVILIVIFDLKIIGILVAPIITNILFFIYIFNNLVWKKSKLTFKKAILKECLKYALPLLPHSLFTWVMLMINKIFINNLDSTSSAGIYDIGFIFANLINIFAWGINQAYVPWFFEKMKDKKNNSNEIAKFADDASILYCSIALLLSLFIKEVIDLFVTEKFSEAWVIVPILSFAYVFNGLYYFFVNSLFYNKKSTKYVSYCTIVSATINVVLNFTLIPKLGIVGSAIGTLCSLIIASVIALIISNKVEKIRFKWKRMYLYAFTGLTLSLFTFLGNYFSNSIFILIKMTIALFLIMIVYRLKKKEIDWFTKTIFTKLNPRKNENY